MEQTTFFEHYRICTNYAGAPQELGRTGAAINYKATDTVTQQPVALQLVPIPKTDSNALAQLEERARSAQKLDHINIARVLEVGVEHGHVAVVSEFAEGETADSWLVAHGPMPADAVLRVGLQVVRALAAATFHGLTHRALEPSNIMIVPGQTADGGWPFVKLLNFALAGSEIYSKPDESGEVGATAAPQFASPEQLLNKPIDFRSEIYSLGATMCFLLTGAVPLAVGGMKARLRARRLPELRRAPKALRNLLVHMLREDPANRPQDPVAFEAEVRDCLTKVERRQAIGRRLGIPMAAVIPRPPKTAPISAREAATATSGRSAFAQVVGGLVATAALLLAVGVVAAFLLPEDAVPFLHRNAEKKIGVPVGVPDGTSAAITQTSPTSPSQQDRQVSASPAAAASVAANQPPAASPATEVASSNENAAPAVTQNSSANATPAASSPAPANPVEIASAKQEAEAPPPAQGPDEEASSSKESGRSKEEVAAEAKTQPQVADTGTGVSSGPRASAETRSESSGATSSSGTRKKTTATATRRSTSKRTRTVAQAPVNDAEQNAPPLPRGRVRARVVGIAPDGRLILRLPTGRIVTATPPGEEEAPRRRVYIERRPATEPSAPYQPFDPDYPFGD